MSREQTERENVCSAIAGLIDYLRNLNLLAGEIETELLKLKKNL